MSDRIRVLQLTGITVGGSAEHLLQLATLLPRDRFETTIALSGGGPLDARSELPGCRCSTTPPRTGRATSSRRHRTGRSSWSASSCGSGADIRRHRYDVVHTHTSVAGAMGRVAAWSAGTPLRVHMLHAFAGHDGVPQPKRSLYRLVERALGMFTTHYVAGSRFIRDTGVRHRLFRPEDVTVIPYSSRMSVGDATAVDRARFREELGLPSDAPLDRGGRPDRGPEGRRPAGPGRAHRGRAGAGGPRPRRR